MPRVEHRADAEKQLGWILVEEVGQQQRPEDAVQFIAEIPHRPSPAV
jgi:hypothetical protein